jgi:hypothetical protein
MNSATITSSMKPMTMERSARYLDEVLLQPNQVDDAAVSTREPESVLSQDGPEHSHADY